MGRDGQLILSPRLSCGFTEDKRYCQVLPGTARWADGTCLKLATSRAVDASSYYCPNFHTITSYGTSCHLLTFPNPTSVPLSNPRSINLTLSPSQPFHFLLSSLGLCIRYHGLSPQYLTKDKTSLERCCCMQTFLKIWIAAFTKTDGWDSPRMQPSVSMKLQS